MILDSLPIDSIYLIYGFFVVLMLVVIASSTRKFIRNIEIRGLRRIKNRERFEPVETESPVADPVKIAKENALKNFNQRFNIIRRFLPVIAVLFFLPILTLPVLSDAPAIYTSFFLGSFTVIIGIAAKPFIENVIAGLVISLGRPIRIGDTVTIDNQYGVIEQITLTYTVLKIWNWRRLVIPNQELLTKEMINFSLQDSFQWKHIEFWVAPESDLEKVEKIAINAVRSSKYFASHEEPAFWVMELEKTAIKCWVAGWVNSPADAWQLGHETRMKLAAALRNEKIWCQNIHASLSHEEKS